jgi:Cof subfamily protein (haloacid dehalogenase superfamily)/HAD superfamily hydrolase (TIGR01509 family)
MDIKLVIADIDGTLLTGKKALTDRTREAVARLRAAGIRFAVTSGRPPRGMAKVVAPLDLTEPMAAFNGGVYIKPDLTTVLTQRTIAPTVAKQVVDYLLQAGLDVWVYRGTDWYLRNPNAFRVAREKSNVGFDPTVVDDLYGLLDAAVKIVGVGENRDRMGHYEAELSASFGALICADRSSAHYVDVTHPEANKGMVVRQAARILQVPLEQIATIGDMPNDIHMLRIVGMGIAMGNSGPEVKRASRHVTTSNEEDGFANAVDTFILGQPPTTRTALGLPLRTRACLFELGGVLTQIAGLEADAWKRMFDEYLRERSPTVEEPFVPFDVVRDYEAHLDGRPHLEGARSFLASRGIELHEGTLRALIERQGEILRERLRQERAETYDGSVRYLRAARDAGLRTAVVSSSKVCGDVLRAAGVADLFDARIDGVVAANKHLAEMPAPDAYLAAAAAVGVEPEQAAVFEDGVPGVEAARAGHFAYVVGVDRFGRSDELRHHGADVVVPDLGALMDRRGPHEPSTPSAHNVS